MLDDITILIHTFMRPEACERLVKSIKSFYPDIKIIIYDDTEFDRGLSWGRNRLVRKAKTKYVFLCDDDFFFTERTNLDMLKTFLEVNNLDMAGVNVDGTYYHGIYKTDGDTVYLLEASENLDFIANCFLAKRSVLLKYKWDERLKLGEHFAYFYGHRGKMKIGFTPHITIGHEHVNTIGYMDKRHRAIGYVYQYMREIGLKKRVDLHGEIMEVPDVI